MSAAGRIVGLYKGERVQMDIDVPRFQPLGRSCTSSEHISTPSGTLVNRVLLEGAATPVMDRYLVFVERVNEQRVQEELLAFGGAAFVQESLWIEFPSIRTYDPGVDLVGDISPGVALFLLTREQAECVGFHITDGAAPTVTPHDYFVLPNEQVIDTRTTMEPYRRILQRYPEGAQRIQADGAEYFQSFDSSDFISGHGSPHSYFGVVNSRYRDRFATSWVLVTAPKFAASPNGQGNHLLSFPILIRFSDTIGFHNIALDQTVSTAIGLSEGEVVRLTPLRIKARNIRRSVFAFRHTIVRVSSTNAMDMEKPIVRIEAGVQDILGVSTGDRVVIESFDRRKEKLGRIVIRQLEDRGVVEDRSRGALNVSALTGDTDIPIVSMDLATRKRLGVQRGDAVYLRPSILSALLKEFSALSLVLLSSIIGAVAADLPLLATALGGTYGLLALAVLWSRFK